jgi:S1-C subfamily serine protease
MTPRRKRILRETLKVVLIVGITGLLERQLAEVQRLLRGSASGVAEAQSRSSEDLNEARRLLAGALSESTREFSLAREALLDSSHQIRDQRREIARLIDERAGAITTALQDRLDREHSALEGAWSRAQASAELMERLEQTLDHDAARMKRLMIYPTVQIRGSGTVGSGVLVYSRPKDEDEASSDAITLILTAHHVVMEVMGDRAPKGLVEEVRILKEGEVFDPEIFSAELVLSDHDRDLALLRLRSGRRFANVAELAPRQVMDTLDVFTRAYAVGCPLGNRPLPTVGEVSSKGKVVGDQVFWMLSAPTFFGNSGGGVYLGSSCQLIGISSMIYTYGKEAPAVVPHLGLFVSMNSISDWLDDAGFAFLREKGPIPPRLLARLSAEKEPPVAERPGQRPVTSAIYPPGE